MKKFWSSAAGIAAAVVGYSAVKDYLHQDTPASASVGEAAYDRAVRVNFENVRKGLPQKLDGSTTIVDVTLDGKVSTYKVVLDLSGPALEDEFTKQEMADWAKDAKRVMIETLCTTPVLKAMLVDHGYTVVYNYWSQKNQFLLDVKVGGSDCMAAKST